MSHYNFPQKTKQEVLERDNFTCQKCGYKGDEKELEIHHVKLKVNEGEEKSENLITLCNICHHYAPENENDFKKYIEEKIDGNILETFRKSQKSISNVTKKGMDKRFEEGNLVTRPPLGYKVIDKKLVIDEDKKLLIQEIFQTFLNETISLNKLSKKYNLSVNGLKKVLKNFTYVGKIKFGGQVLEGKHAPLISNELFIKVQKKLEEIERK
jgi:hypothetical protein